MSPGSRSIDPKLYRAIAGVVAVALFLGGCATKSLEDVAEHRWIELQSDNFVMMTDAGEKRGRAFFAGLDEFRNYLLGQHPEVRHKNSSPVRVVAFANGNSFHSIVDEVHVSGGFQQTYRGDYAIADLSVRIPDGRLTIDSTRGSRLGRSTIVPIYVYAARALLQHEYVEYVLATQRDLRYPLWFREGYAEYLSTFRVINDRTALVGEIPRYRLAVLQNLDWIPLDALFGARSYDMGHPIEVFYAQSWLIVHYLMSDPERAQSLQDYIALIYGGASEKDAFYQAFKLTEQEFYSAIRTYSRREKFPMQRIDVGAQSAPQITTREMRPDEVKFHLGYIKLQFSGQQAAGVGLLEGALKANPDNIAARAELARRYLYDQRFDEAHQLIEVGLITGPMTPDMLTLQGHLLVHNAVQAYHDDRADWYEVLREGRRNFRQALEIDPKFAEAYVAYGQSFIADDVVPAEAFSALETAVALLPSNVEILYLLGRLHLNNEELDRAEELFREVVEWGRNPEFIARARELLKEIASHDTQASGAAILDPRS